MSKGKLASIFISEQMGKLSKIEFDS